MWHKILILIVVASGLAAHADGMARLNLGYGMSDDKTGSSETKTTTQNIDVAGAYLWPSHFMVLGQYAMESESVTSGTSTTNYNRTSYGPGIGWVTKKDLGLYVDAIYYFSSTYVEPGQTQKGWGYQLDLDLRIAFSRFSMLAGFAYANYTYTKNDVGNLSPAPTHTGIQPRLGVYFEF